MISTPSRRATGDPGAEVIRPRTLMLVVGAQALMIGWVSDSEITRSVYLVCYSLMMPTVLYLLAARLFARWLPFTRRELLLSYVVLTATIPIVGFGGLRFLLPGLGFLSAFSPTQPVWTSYLGMHARLPLLLGPAASDLFRGGHGVPWHAWARPLLFWSAYLLLLAGTWLGLAAVLRRLWIVEERLSFPIAALPLQVLDPADSLLRSRLFWLAFLVPVVLQSLLQWHDLMPTIPAFQLKATDLRPLFFTTPPWNALPSLNIGFYPTAIGLAYLVPTDISFSCWFFWLTSKLSYAAGGAFGWAGAGSGASRFPYAEEQATGAWLAFAMLTLWVTRRRYIEARHRFSSDEQRAVKWGSILAVTCLCGSAALMAAAGMTVLTAAGTALIYAAFVLTGARVRAEAGGMWTFAPFTWTPPFVVNQLLGTQGVPTGSLIAGSHFGLVQADIRAQSLPFLMEGLKIGAEAAIPWRTVLAAVAAGTVSALLIGEWSSLSTFYQVGVATAKSDPLTLWKVQSVMGNMDATVRNRISGNATGASAVVMAGAFTLLLAYLRTRLPFFPFHPVGYVVSNTYTMDHFFVPFLAAWAVKVVVLRYGGLALYRRSLAGFLGLTFGDIVIQAVWTLLSHFFGFSVYQFLS